MDGVLYPTRGDRQPDASRRWRGEVGAKKRKAVEVSKDERHGLHGDEAQYDAVGRGMPQVKLMVSDGRRLKRGGGDGEDVRAQRPWDD